MSTTRKLKIKGVLTPRSGDTQTIDPFSGYLTDSRYLDPKAGLYLESLKKS